MSKYLKTAIVIVNIIVHVLLFYFIILSYRIFLLYKWLMAKIIDFIYLIYTIKESRLTKTHSNYCINSCHFDKNICSS